MSEMIATNHAINIDLGNIDGNERNEYDIDTQSDTRSVTLTEETASKKGSAVSGGSITDSTGGGENPPLQTTVGGLIIATRNGLSSLGRVRWYTLLPKIVNERLDSIDSSSLAYILSSFLARYKACVKSYELENTHIPTRHITKLLTTLDRPGIEKYLDLLNLVSYFAKISTEERHIISTLVYKIAQVLSRIDICFGVITDILSNPDWYFASKYLDYRIRLYTFRDGFNKLAPKTCSMLEEIGALSDEYLNNIFCVFFFNVLPGSLAYKVLDNFMVEGDKALYRFGFALLYLFKSKVKEKAFSTGEKFWEYVKAQFKGSQQTQMTVALYDIAFDRKRSAIQRIRKSLTLKRRQITAIKTEMKAIFLNSAGRLQSAAFVSSMEVTAALATWFPRKLMSQSNILTTTYALRLGMFMLAHIIGNNESDLSDNISKRTKAPNARPLYNVNQFKLHFSTIQNGWDFSNMYTCTNYKFPCIILIKTLESGSVFGCIVTSPVQPSAQVQGTKNGSFCFKLDGKNAIFYPVVGSCLDSQGSHESLLARNKGDANRTNTAMKCYAKFTEKEIIIGDSGAKNASTAPHAIHFINDLRTCRVGCSDTYLNAPLTEESSPCAIECVEIFCGPWNQELQGIEDTLSRTKLEV